MIYLANIIYTKLCLKVIFHMYSGTNYVSLYNVNSICKCQWLLWGLYVSWNDLFTEQLRPALHLDHHILGRPTIRLPAWNDNRPASYSQLYGITSCCLSKYVYLMFFLCVNMTLYTNIKGAKTMLF